LTLLCRKHSAQAGNNRISKPARALQLGAIPEKGIMEKSSIAQYGVVVLLDNKRGGVGTTHEQVTQCELARRVAALKGYEYADSFDPARKYGGPVYFVPSDTLVDIALAHDLGIRGEHDLFGGVVPYPYVATKTITHLLPGADALAPLGWSPRFGAAVAEVVLPGYSAFSLGDARAAGMRLLRNGAVRIKKADGIGGIGQTVAYTPQQLEQQLSTLEQEDAFAEGVVLERNLNQVKTLSVGQVRLDGLTATYYGVQRLTVNNHGVEVYGGSELTVVRGDYDALLRLEMAPEVSTAVRQAGVYHATALDCFPGMFVSRSNYDIVQGVDDRGHWRSGVLEQSWRMGGASGAELAAVAAFHADAGLRVVSASTTELYGESGPLPDDAIVYFRGTDARVGPMIKYARLDPDAHP
jgi:hypothetical protein